MNPTANTTRLAWPVLAVAVALAAVAPLFVSDFFLNVILTKALWLGIAAASLIFLAAYGGIFVAGSLAWGVVVDGFRPDRYDLAGAVICLVGVAVIMYAPRAS